MKNLILIFITLLPLVGTAQNPLAIPDTLTGEDINLNLDYSHVELYAGFQTNTIGYNQAILGPTLILQKGQEITLNVTNNLNDATTLHWHGLHVAAANDGGPHTVIDPGETWSPSFTVLDHAATYWYHPHLHEHTEEQVTMGAAGFIIVRDEDEAALTLPRSYGVDDFPLVIQSRAFDANKQLMMGTAADDEIMCNATLNAYLDVPAQVIRMRLLNGSTERVYNIGLEGNIPFYQIATDGGLLDAPVTLTRLRLSPGERAEILINFNGYESQSIHMMSFASELPSGIYGAANPSVMPIGSISGYSNNPLNGSDFNILQFNVGEPLPNAVMTIPAALVNNVVYATSDVDETRTMQFRPQQMGPVGMLNGPFVINNQTFDMNVINEEIDLDNVEIWELTNMTAISHPFHIHDVQFFILDIDGVAPPANMQGRKDVVLVPPMGGTVRFITKFEDFADDEVPYMYHCHMLSHEDAGMMGQFIVVGKAVGLDDFGAEDVLVFPNPSEGILHIKGLSSAANLELYDVQGQLLLVKETTKEKEDLDLTNLPTGLYFLEVQTDAFSKVFKVVKR